MGNFSWIFFYFYLHSIGVEIHFHLELKLLFVKEKQFVVSLVSSQETHRILLLDSFSALTHLCLPDRTSSVCVNYCRQKRRQERNIFVFSNMRPGAEEVDVHDRCFISLCPTGRLRSLSWPRPPVALGILTTCFCDLRPHAMINDDNFS